MIMINYINIYIGKTVQEKAETPRVYAEILSRHYHRRRAAKV